MIQHSVAPWCFPVSLEELCEKCVELEIKGVDLLHPAQVEQIEPYGLTCPMTAAPEHESGLGCIEKAFNRTEHHQALLEIYKEIIPAAAAAGVGQVICFSGNREGMDDGTGLENCARGLDPVLELAERHGVLLVMELLNSKVDHPGYQCDHTEWGVALCEKVGHPRLKLLYDIYHMQIMEGDVISTIRKYHPYFSHYHTAGVPGRHEFNLSQEISYPAVCQAILETGYEGFIAHEYLPTTNDPFEFLPEALRLCRNDYNVKDELHRWSAAESM